MAGAGAGVGAADSGKRVIDGFDDEGEPIIKANLSKDRGDVLFDLLWKTGLHKKGYPEKVKQTFLITEVTMKEGNTLCVFENVKLEDKRRNKGHAEIQFFAWMRNNHDKLVSKHLTIYINYSPCPDCCEDINTFCRENKGFISSMEIICSQLYFVRRPSCLPRNTGCLCHFYQRKAETREKIKFHDLLLERLPQLDARVKVQPFNEDHWKSLSQLLSKYILDQRVATAPCLDPLADYFSKLSVSDNEQSSYKRPNNEDEWLLKDFDELQLWNQN